MVTPSGVADMAVASVLVIATPAVAKAWATGVEIRPSGVSASVTDVA
jgi:hypothetical protein